MAIRKQRGPRPGEVLSYVSLRHGLKVTPEDGKHGPQVRVSPTPCCGRAKHGNCITINTATGLWCCFKCKRKGNWYGFTKLMGSPIPDPYLDAPPVDFALYDQIRARLRRPVTGGHHPALLAYCKSRGFTGATLDAWRVSTCGPEAIRVPLYAQDDAGAWKVANARCRRVINRDEDKGATDWFEVKGGPTGLAMGNHLLGQRPASWDSGEPSWSPDWLAGGATTLNGGQSDPGLEKSEPLNSYASLKNIKRVLIVEGQWDAMTAWQLGIPNVLSLPNGAAHVDVSGLLRYVPDDAEVWLAVDMDEAGDHAAEVFFAQLGTKARRLLLPHKDLNAWLAAEPGLTAEQVLATAERDEVEEGPTWVSFDLIEEMQAAGIITETPWSKLTARLGGGFRECQTTGILAPSGVGKTTVANNILAVAAPMAKVGVIQLEGELQKNMLELKKQIYGYHHNGEPQTIIKNVLMSSLVGKKVTWRETIQEVERMAKAGARLIAVDNWDYITADDGREKMTAYGEFQELAKSYRFHGIVVWQPSKVDRGVTVNSGQQKGMSKALQDADVYITMNKFGLCRRLDVEKVRGVVDNGESVIWLKYDEPRACLFETAGQADLKPVTEEPDKL